MFRFVFSVLAMRSSAPVLVQPYQDNRTVAISTLFNRIEKGDSAKLHSAFAEEVTMASFFRAIKITLLL